MITVDARRCGAGKTTGHNGIYARINKIVSSGDRVLVVVPSIALQHEYVKALPQINFTIINSSDIRTQSTVSALLEAYRSPSTTAMLITHKTFVLNQVHGYNNAYHLIIDEAIDDIINVVDVVYDTTTWQPNLHIDQLFSFSSHIDYETWCADPRETTSWYKMRRLQDPGITTFSDSEAFKRITDPNYELWVTANSWSILTGTTNGSAKVITTLSPHIFHNWASIHIAAAAFNDTVMSLWMKYNNISYEITHQFERHNGNIHLHTTDNPVLPRPNSDKPMRIQISKSMLRRDENLRRQYHDYVQTHSTDRVLSIRNNCFDNLDAQLETRVTHNAHGLNGFRDYTNINIETALIPDTQLVNFLKNNWLVTCSERDADRHIAIMFRGYRFYQIATRGYIRNPDRNPDIPYHIFVLDETAALALVNYFEIAQMHVIQLKYTYQSLGVKPSGRPPKYSNDEQRKQANRERMRAKRASAKKSTQ